MSALHDPGTGRRHWRIVVLGAYLVVGLAVVVLAACSAPDEAAPCPHCVITEVAP